MIHHHQPTVSVLQSGNPPYPPSAPPGYVYPGYPHGSPPPPYPQPHPVGYYPTYPQTQQTTSVVVLNSQPSTKVIRERNHTNHLLHLIITLFFWPWIIVWIIVCMMEKN